MIERGAYSVKETAERLGIGRDAAYEGVKSGVIPSIRVGNRIIVPKAALERMLESASKE